MDLSLDEFIKMKKGSGADQTGTKSNRAKNQFSLNLQRLEELGARSGIINARRAGPLAVEPSNKLRISNLHPNVDDTDIRDLFQEIGPLRKAVVYRNSAGVSLGVAEVVFKNAQDMNRAVKTYDNRTLDGKLMSVTIVSGNDARSTSSNSSILSRLGIDLNADARKVMKKKHKGPKKGKRKHKPSHTNEVPMTVEELDADIESYRQSKGQLN